MSVWPQPAWELSKFGKDFWVSSHEAHADRIPLEVTAGVLPRVLLCEQGV